MPKGKKFEPKAEDKPLYNKILKSEKLKDCYDILTERNKVNYPPCWREFFLFIKQNPDEYIIDLDTIFNKRKEVEYRKKIEKDILSFFNYLLKKDKKPSPSYILQYKSAIYKLLKRNNIKISDNFKDDLNILTPRQTSVTQQIISTKEEFEKIFNFLNTQGKAIFLMQLSSGSRIEEILNVRIQDLDLRYKYPRFRVRYDNSKNGSQTPKRCSRETKKWLQIYLTQRDKWLQTKINRSKGKGKTGIEGRLFPMSKQNATTYIWNVALEKAGLNEVDEQSGIHKRSTHTLRKYFRKQCKKAGEDKFGRWMANHEKNMDDTYIYDTFNDTEIDELYSKVENELLIFETTDTTNAEINKLKDKIKKLERVNTISKEDKDFIETQLKIYENRFSKIERILKRNLQDTINPVDKNGIILTKEEQEYEEQLENEMIQQKEKELKQLLNKKDYKDSEIVYLDSVPYLSKKQTKKPKANDLIKYIMNNELINKLFDLSIEEQKKFFEKAKQFKNSKDVPEILKYSANLSVKEQNQIINDIQVTKKGKSLRQIRKDSQSGLSDV